MNPPVFQVRMENLAQSIIARLAKEGFTPQNTYWEAYRTRFFDHWWSTGYTIHYLSLLARRGAEDYVLRFYDAEKGKGPPAG